MQKAGTWLVVAMLVAFLGRPRRLAPIRLWFGRR